MLLHGVAAAALVWGMETEPREEAFSDTALRIYSHCSCPENLNESEVVFVDWNA